MNDVTGIVYLHTDSELRSVSIIGKPANRTHQAEWRLGQIVYPLGLGVVGSLFGPNAILPDVGDWRVYR